MDNPMGGIRRGLQSISEGYSKLFGGPAIVQVTFRFLQPGRRRLASVRWS
jgi:hypothetical protein